MNVCYSGSEMSFNFEFNKICILLGDNENPKSDFLSIVKEGFEGGLDKSFMVDNITVSKNEYEVLYITDDQDFESVFKFTKTNLYKNCLYQTVFTDEFKRNFEDLMKAFNKYIRAVDQELDTCFDNTIHFDTRIDDIETLISENTIVCLKDQPVKLTEKYYKKMLLIQLISFYIRHLDREKVIVFIEDIDAYFSESSLVVVCQLILELAKSGEVYFFVTGTSSFLYEYFYDKDRCYKVRGKKVYYLDDLNRIAKEVFIRNQYYIQQSQINTVQDYLKENLRYITEEDVQYVLSNYFLSNVDRVGRLFCNDHILLVNPLLSNVSVGVPIIPYTDLYERELFSVICDRLGIDKIIQ